MNILVTVGAFLFFHVTALAADIFYHPENSSQYVLVTPENGLWVVDHYEEKSGKLPNLLSHHAFSSRLAAEKFQKEHFANWFLRKSRTSEEPIFVTEKSQRVLWRVKEEWSDAWEQKFADWVHQEVTESFFVDHNISVDCADVAFVVRWIFARVHALPAANRLAGGRVLFTQDSMKSEWGNLPTDPDWHKDKLFLRALKYLASHAYTHSLYDDSYPIAIQPYSLTPGVHHLSLGGRSGHTLIVTDTQPLNPMKVPIVMMASTVPAEARMLIRSGYSYQRPAVKEGGFMRMRWPVRSSQGWKLKSAQQMPHYSMEQYDEKVFPNSSPHPLHVYRRINPHFDPLVLIQSLAQEVQQALKIRQQVVEDGYKHCQSHDCTEGSAGYEDWSTPSRDRQLEQLLNLLESTYNELSSLDPRISAWWAALLKQEDFFEIDGETYSLEILQSQWRKKLYSSDPQLPTENRWNLTANSLLQLVQKRIQEAITARQTKIKKNTCKNCVYASADFTEFHTFAEDKQILENLLLVNNYCDQHATSRCQQMKTLLQTATFQWDHQNVSFSEAFDRAPFLNSDPRSPAAERWPPSMGTVISIKGYVSAITESANLIAYRFEGGNLVLRKSDNSALSLPQGAQKTFLVDQDLVYQLGQSLVVENMVTGQKSVHSLKGFTYLSFHGPYILSQEDHKASLLKVENHQIIQLAEGTSIDFVNNGFAIINDQEKVFIYDLRTPQPTIHTLSKVDVGAISSVYGIQGNWAMAYSNGKTIQMNLQSGQKTQEYPFSIYSELHNEKDFYWAIIQSEESVKVATFDQNFNVLDVSLPLGTHARDMGHGRYLISWDGGFRYGHFNKGNFTEITLPVKTDVVAVKWPLILTQKADDHRIIHAETGEDLLQQRDLSLGPVMDHFVSGEFYKPDYSESAPYLYAYEQGRMVLKIGNASIRGMRALPGTSDLTMSTTAGYLLVLDGVEGLKKF